MRRFAVDLDKEALVEHGAAAPQLAAGDRVLRVLGPQNDVVTHPLALPHKDVAAAVETVRASAAASASAAPPIRLRSSFWC